MDNEEWKTEGIPATKQDCIKYCHQNTRLLVTTRQWEGIFEVSILRVTPKGLILVNTGGPFGAAHWMMAESLIVIEILPPLEGGNKSIIAQ